jgi:hypothetical protein
MNNALNHLGIDLMYRNGYNLFGFEREGIGVYIGNLVSSLLHNFSDLSIYLLIDSQNIKNAKKFLNEYNILNEVSIVSRGDSLSLISAGSASIILHYDEKPHYLISPCTNPSPCVYDLKFPYWRNNVSDEYRLLLKYKARVSVDPLSYSLDSIIHVCISLVGISHSDSSVVIESSELTSTSKRSVPIVQTFSLAPDVLTKYDQIRLDVKIKASPPGLILTVSDSIISLKCPSKDHKWIITNESYLDIPTRVNNSMIDAVLFHHIDTYVSSYSKPCIYHLHDLLFVEHANRWSQSFGSSSAVMNLMQSRAVASDIKSNSLMIYSSEHVKNEHFRASFPGKYGKLSHAVVRNTFISSEFAVNASLASQSIREKCNELMPYITYPTQPRATKQLGLLELITNKLRQYIPEVKLVLTCSKDAYEQMQQYSAPEYIVFLESVSRQDLYYVYTKASACVVTTCYEASLPWQFLESLIADTPSICYKSKIVSEFLNLCLIDQRLAAQSFFENADQAVELLLKKIPGLCHSNPVYMNPSNCLESLRLTLGLTSWDDISRCYFQEIVAFLKKGSQ